MNELSKDLWGVGTAHDSVARLINPPSVAEGKRRQGLNNEHGFIGEQTM